MQDGDDEDVDDPIMLGADGVTVINESSGATGDGVGGGGGGIGGPDTPPDSGSQPIDTIVTNPPTTPEEEALAEQVRAGAVTPEQALAFFRMTFPFLNTLPTFDSALHMWLFPQAPPTGDAALESSGIGFGSPADTGDAGGTVGGGGGIGDGGGGGDGSAPGDGGGSTVDPEPSPGEGSTPRPIDQGGGDAGGPGIPAPGPGDGGVVDISEPLPVPQPTHPFREPITDDDGNPIKPLFLDVAQRQLDGAIRDRIDENVPALLRTILTQLIPATYVAALLERHIVNPLLAAPAHLYEAGLRLERAARFTEQGEFARAVEDVKAADENFKQAALAIMAVVPLGEGVGATTPAAERLAGVGVEYLGMRMLPRTASEWARHQMWVTGSQFEHKFLIDGAIPVMVDGFVNRTGLEFVDRVSNMVLVEAKMASRIESALRVLEPGATLDTLGMADKLFLQLERYLLLARRLGVSVRYVVTEAAEGSPVTNRFRDLLIQQFPELFETGILEVISKPPPPESFTGFIP